jgi:hypothetical protein
MPEPGSSEPSEPAIESEAERTAAVAGNEQPLSVGASAHDLQFFSVTPEEGKQWYLYPEFDTFVIVSLLLLLLAAIDPVFEVADAAPLITGLAAVYMITCAIRRARL